jgi:hypothetical protein
VYLLCSTSCSTETWLANTAFPDNLDLISNNYFLANEGHIKEYLHGIQGRFCNNGASTAWAMPTITYSAAPTAPACTYGCIDYGTIDQPIVRLYFNGDATATYATINAYAAADIGSNSGMRIDVVGFTYSAFSVRNSDTN